MTAQSDQVRISKLMRWKYTFWCNWKICTRIAWLGWTSISRGKCHCLQNGQCREKTTFDFDSAFETWCGIYRPPTSQGTRRCKMPLWMSVFHSHFALRFQLRHLHWSHHPADLYIWAGHGRSALLDHLEQRVGCGESWHMPGQICICFLQFWFQFSFMCVSVLRNPWSKLQLLH